jgi:transaldolase
MASGEMGCHSATIPFAILEELAHTAYDPSTQPGGGEPGVVKKVKKGNYYKDGAPIIPQRLLHLLNQDPLAFQTSNRKLAVTDVDYLAEAGRQLHEYILTDLTTKQRLDDALGIFTEAENLSKEKVEAAMRLVSP